jgi:hypothetical protein
MRWEVSPGGSCRHGAVARSAGLIETRAASRFVAGPYGVESRRARCYAASGARRAPIREKSKANWSIATVIERSQQVAGFRFPDIFFGLPRRARTNEKIEKRC